MKKRMLVFFSSVLLFALCQGCAQRNITDPTEATYNMEYALDAHGYCLFVNKEINTVMNQLSTQMLIAMRIDDGFPTDDALAGAEVSLSVVQECRRQIEIMYPPRQYEPNRENVLRMIENAENDLKSMIKVLKADPEEYDQLTDISMKMQTDFIALSGEFNIYYK